MSTDLFSKVSLLIDEYVRPRLQADGGDITLHEVTDDGVVTVELIGACAGCSCAGMTMEHAVKETLVYFLPEIKEVKDITKHAGFNDEEDDCNGWKDDD